MLSSQLPDATRSEHSLLYHWYEMSHAALKPARAAAEAAQHLFESPFNPFAYTAFGRHASAACEVFERTTRRYDRPTFGIARTDIGGASIAVTEEEIWSRPFCRLIHFRRDLPDTERERDPRILLVAPMSGHFATLLRGTIETLLPDHEIVIG